MEAVKVEFSASDLVGCFEEHGFTSLPTDWCDFLFESDCHTIEAHKTPQENMFRLLWRHSMWDMDMDGVDSLSTYMGVLVYDVSRVIQFINYVRESEAC